MWARTRFDLGWDDIRFGLCRTVGRRSQSRAQHALETLWCPERSAIACTSVRSAFDLLLRALRLPPGSEVACSAINIGGMVDALTRHGLVPVPVDLDLATAAPRPARLERAIGPRTRLVLIAPLFGARLDLAPIVALARRHGALVVEDAAQAYAGPAYTGHPDADVSLFSFGPLKTATALGGALARVRDPALRARMRDLQRSYPEQSAGAYRRRLLQFAGIKALTYRPGFTAVSRGLRAAGRDVDSVVADAVRGLARQKDPRSLQLRPCEALLALLSRRIRRFDDGALAARKATAQRLAKRLRGHVVLPGTANPIHDHWAFPVLVAHPQRVIASLRATGFDAAPMMSLRAIDPPAHRPVLAPVAARSLIEQSIFLPCYPAMGDAVIDALARATIDAVGESEVVACEPPADAVA